MSECPGCGSRGEVHRDWCSDLGADALTDSDIPVGTRIPGEGGWAEDFDHVWHRMSSGDWAKGVGPADPVACCGRQIDSVHHSTFDPHELADSWADERVCGCVECDQNGHAPRAGNRPQVG